MGKLTKSVIDEKFSAFKEKLRKYCRKVLKTETARKKAEKVIGYKYSYIRAALDQRDQGGLEFWFKLGLYCSAVERGMEIEDFDSFFDLDTPFPTFKDLSPSEMLFQNLSNIPIVTEDTKYRLAMNLQDMLTDLNKDVQRKMKSNRR